MSTDTTDPTETADTPHEPADTGAPTPRPQPRPAPPMGARIHTLNRPNMVSVGTMVWLASERESGREVARGKTGILFFDYAARKPASVPPAFVAKVAG